MSMDLTGIKPKNDKGKSFSNNVWRWRPLWEYCFVVKAINAQSANKGAFNDGNKITERQTINIVKILKEEIKSGRTKEYEIKRNKFLSELPLVKCEVCNGTGKRKIEGKVITCNGCEGKGIVKDFSTWYQFDVQNVKNFIEFCENSGGFTIW